MTRKVDTLRPALSTAFASFGGLIVLHICVGPPARCPFSPLCWGRFPAKMDYRKKGTLIRTPLLEDLVVEFANPPGNQMHFNGVGRANGLAGPTATGQDFWVLPAFWPTCSTLVVLRKLAVDWKGAVWELGPVSKLASKHGAGNEPERDSLKGSRKGWFIPCF